VASPELQPIIDQMRARPSYKTFTVDELRAGLLKMFTQYPAPAALRREPVRAGGIPAEWVSMPGAAPERVVFYLHGGAYVRGSIVTHLNLIAGISHAAGARVLAIDYRLGPENPFPAAIDDAVAAYRWLIGQGMSPARVVIAGDSAGGGLALATLLTLRDGGDPLPAAAVLLSPWTDLAATGASIEGRAAADPMLSREYLLDMARMYLGSADPRDPRASPVFADPRGLPPLLIQVGTAEVLYDDATRVAAQALAREIDVTFEAWPDMVHAWHLFAPVLPEGRRAIASIGAFIRRRLEGSPPDARPGARGVVTVSESGQGRLGQLIDDGRHRLPADEPLASGGTDSGPNPYELLLAALGACTSMTLRLYAERKQWPLEHIAVRLRHEKIYAKDCADCETKEGKVDRIERHIEMKGALDESQRARLMEIADRCPVHRTLHSEIEIVTTEARA